MDYMQCLLMRHMIWDTKVTDTEMFPKKLLATKTK